MAMAQPTMASTATDSWRTSAPSSSDTTGTMYTLTEARVLPSLPALLAMTTNANAVPNTPSATTARKGPQAKRTSLSDGMANGVTSTNAIICAPQHGEAAVLLLQRHREVQRDAVEDECDEDEADAEPRVVAAAARGHCDEHHTGEADSDADHLLLRWQATGHERSDHGDEQWRRAIEHAGHRRRHTFLGEREDRQRDGHPDHAQQHDAGHVDAVDSHPASSGEQAQRERTEPHAHGRDECCRERLQTLGDEVERRTPHQPWQRERGPVDRRHLRMNVGCGRRRGHCMEATGVA